jgi:membrane-bound lytic murein transglycosylase B
VLCVAKSDNLKIVTLAASLALVWMAGEASGAQCGNTSAGFDAWKSEFANEARARGVTASGISALMGTSYTTATIAADRGQRSFSLSLEQFMAKRGASTIVARSPRLPPGRPGRSRAGSQSDVASGSSPAP